MSYPDYSLSRQSVNRFVVIFPSSSWDYPDMPCPIETPLSREALIGEMELFHAGLTEEERCSSNPIHLLDLGGTGLLIRSTDISQVDHVGPGIWDYKERCEPVVILTLDEWYARGPAQHLNE
jgi:hypothetical protein